MEYYRNLGGCSNVVSYAFEVDAIHVMFSDNSIYIYSYRSAGKDHIEEMKRLAVNGHGLNRYINIYCKKLYENKFRFN